MYNNYIQTQTTVIGRSKKQIKLILSALLLSLAFGIFGGVMSLPTKTADASNVSGTVTGTFSYVSYELVSNRLYCTATFEKFASPGDYSFSFFVYEDENDTSSSKISLHEYKHNSPTGGEATISFDFVIPSSVNGKTVYLLTGYFGAMTVTNPLFVYGSSFILPDDPTAEGYAFAGWYYDAELKQPYDGKAITGDISLYAGWYIAQIAEREHFSFAGWYLDEALTKSATGVAVALDTPIYPKFETRKYTVTFVSDLVEVESLTLDSLTAFTPEAVSHVGYNFIGWYTDEAKTNAWVAGSELTSDITLYAKFEIIVYKVTFYVKGEVYEVLNVPHGSVLGEQPEVVALAEKYNMTGLYSDTALTMPIRTDTPITNELVLYASVDNDSQLDTFKGFGIGAGTVGIILVVVIVIFLLKRR